MLRMVGVAVLVAGVGLCACSGSTESTETTPNPTPIASTTPPETVPAPTDTKKAPDSPSTPTTPATPTTPTDPDPPVVPPACPGLAAPVQLKAFGGAQTIRGTVTLPPGSANKYVQFIVSESFSGHPRISFGNSFEYAKATSDSIAYEVHGAKLGTKYFVEAYLSENGTRANADPADGYYAGGAADATGPNDATAIVLTSAAPDICNADFTVGPIACYANAGESCRFDDDCRSTFCACPGAGKYFTSLRTGACVDNVCTQLACPASCANGDPIASMGSCIDFF